MKTTAQLHELGQSLWLDNITREMLDSGQLQRYIDEFSFRGDRIERLGAPLRLGRRAGGCPDPVADRR